MPHMSVTTFTWWHKPDFGWSPGFSIHGGLTALSQSTWHWQIQILSESMSYPATIGGAVFISASGDTAISAWPLHHYQQQTKQNKQPSTHAGFTPDAEAQHQARRAKESQPPIQPHVKPLCRLHQRRFSPQRQGASRLVAIVSASSQFFPLAASLSRHETHLKLILNDINDIFYMI